MDPSHPRTPFPDYFSGHAADYEAFRPTYPEALFDNLASLAPGRALAWDCGTGNGQAALSLAERFERVVATDASVRQIEQARPHPRIDYLVAPAERTPLPAASVDLITVALAFHWFDVPRFHVEVKRVARPDGIVACWTYHLQSVNPEVDAVIRRLYAEVLGPYWAPEVKHIENGYRTLPFPFEEVALPAFALERSWNLERMVDYMATWSGWQRYCTTTGRDPREEILGDLTQAWGDPTAARRIVWPLHLRVGRVSGR